MVVEDSVDAFDHFNCRGRRAHINQHSVVNMPNKNTPSNRKHEVEYGLVVTETGTMENDLTSFSSCAISYVHLYGTIGHKYLFLSHTFMFHFMSFLN